MAIRDKEQQKKHGVVRDERGQDQPKDKDRAQQAEVRHLGNAGHAERRDRGSSQDNGPVKG
jgi:hypothetical protein